MVFSSLDFLYAFLPLVLIAYATVPAACRNITILAASLVFYAWTEGEFMAVLVAYILINWMIGLAIEKTPPYTVKRRWITAGAVLINLSGLLVFKYTWFLVDNVHKVFQGTGLQVLADPRIHLPIGISFFAFQGISYALDISRGQVKAARNLITFGAYKSFFPQLLVSHKFSSI